MLKNIYITIFCMILLVLFSQAVDVHATSNNCAQEHARLITEYKEIPKVTSNLNRYDVNIILFMNELDNAIKLCKDTINEPSLILLKAQTYEENLLDYDKAYAEYFAMALRFKNKYPAFAESGLFKQINLAFNKGDCDDVISTYNRFVSYFPNPNEAYQNKLTEFVDKCNEKKGTDKKKVKIFNEGAGEGNNIDVLFFGYGYNNKDEFIEDAKFFAYQGTEYMSQTDILREYKYRNKFNHYYYDQILSESDCNNKGGKNKNSCACKEEKLEKIVKGSGMDRYVVLIKASSESWCRANARFGERAFVVVGPVENKNDRLNSYRLRYKYYKYMVAEELYNPEGESFEDVYKGSEANKIIEMKLYNPNLLLYIHEVGHAYYGFQDEYVEEGQRDDPNSPNCAQNKSEAQNWWGHLVDKEIKTETANPIEIAARKVGYYQGCSYTEDNVRPTFKGVMSQQRDFGYAHLKPTYGPVNNERIKEILDQYD